MNRLSGRVATAGLITAALVAGTPAAPASAATYGGQCGPGYRVIDKSEIGRKGTVFLAYSPIRKVNCVVTVRGMPGKAVWMSAYIRGKGDRAWVEDSGPRTTVAGPVLLRAGSRCVEWGGTIGTRDKPYRTTC